MAKEVSECEGREAWVEGAQYSAVVVVARLVVWELRGGKDANAKRVVLVLLLRGVMFDIRARCSH